MRLLYLLSGMTILLSACSNPFSSQKPSVINENPKPTNTSCNDVRLDISELTAKQVRSVIHCLNQASELQEIENWIQDVSDQEMEPWLNQFNSILKEEPQFLYALKEIYTDEKNSGNFQNLITNLFSKIQTKEERLKLVNLVDKHSNWIQSLLTSNEYQFNVSLIPLLAEVKSFNRAINEQYLSGNLNSIIQNIDQYHHQKDSLRFVDIFELFSKSPRSSIGKSNNAEKVAGFLDWLMAENRLEVFSKAAESLSTKPIQCFQGNKSIHTPINVLLTELQEISPEEVSDFFQKRVTSILLIGQGYCSIPAEVLTAAQLLLKSTEQETLVPFFSMVQPLLNDDRFIKLLSSNSFRELSKNLSKNNNGHLFQDLVTLIDWFNKNPISKSNTAKLLDTIFDEFSADEIIFLAELIPEDSTFYKTVSKIILSLPKTKGGVFQNGMLKPFTKQSFAPVLGLMSKMNEERKIIPIIDRIIELFRNLLDRGKTNFKKITPQKAAHAIGTSSQYWELGFWKNTISANDHHACSKININADFFHPSNISSDEYLEKLEELSLCFGENQSFASLKDLANHLISPDSDFQKFNKFVFLQEDVMNFIFSLDSVQALDTLETFLKTDRQDLQKIKGALKAASGILSESKTALHESIQLRKLIGKYLSKKETYLALDSQNNESNSDAQFVTDNLRDKLRNLVQEKLPGLFNEYCANLNANSPECEIEGDQVSDYIRSPALLAEKITAEYLSSSQSWIHPLEFKKWNTNRKNPKNVSTIEFHLNPLIQQFENTTAPTEGIFDFIKRNQKSDWKLFSFLKEKSQSFSVIPYIFQTSKFPESSQEFHQLIRLRIVSDLDRLELLAINADFKPFGIMKNFGMNFITEIATSWGDVPILERPKMGTSETLSTARASILHQYSKYNLDVLQRVGSCDPRGKNRLGRWFQNRLCRGELSDIRARLFNLNFVLSVLDDRKELSLLRDLFYSIYEHNNKEQLGVFTNGVKDDLYVDYPVDLLKVIPKIARLGLLHQAGVAIANNNDTATKSIVDILFQTSRENRVQPIAIFLSTAAGHQFIRETIDLSMELNTTEGKNISNLLDSLSRVDNQEWLVFLIEVLKQNPSTISQFSPSLRAALTRAKTSALKPEMLNLISSISKDLKNPALVNEVSAIIKSISDSQDELVTLLNLELSMKITGNWLKILSADENQKFRSDLSDFVTGSSFDHFCDVFSDSQMTSKTYNFLENSHQNSGVLTLLEECRRFLH